MKYINFLFAVLLLFNINCIRDMSEQPSIRPFESTNQNFPKNNVAIDEIIEISEDIDTEYLKNPFQKNRRTIEKGKIYYEYYCLHCHGEKADGESIVGQSLEVKPYDLTSDEIQSFSDGELFYIITFGEGDMPSLKETVRQEERWLVINYLRTFKKIE